MMAAVLMGAPVARAAEVGARSSQLKQISELESLIADFYLHPGAALFLENNFAEGTLQRLHEELWELRANRDADWQLYYSEEELAHLEAALNGLLLGMAPRQRQFGEAVATDMDLRFRSTPAMDWIISELPYGTVVEILGAVAGESVSWDDNWYRIRYNQQVGYVHRRYVRHLYASAYRQSLLRQVFRQHLWLLSLMEGWSIEFSPTSVETLRTILNNGQALMGEGWEMRADLHYLRQTLSLDSVQLETFSRSRLVASISTLEQDLSKRDATRYTEASWAEMAAVLETAQTQLIEEWQLLLTEAQLEELHALLKTGESALERYRPASSNPLPTEPVYEALPYEADDSHTLVEIIIFYGVVALLAAGGYFIIKFNGVFDRLKISKEH